MVITYKGKYYLTQRDHVSLKILMLSHGYKSIREFARGLGMNYTVLYRMLRGERACSKDLLDAFKKLGVDMKASFVIEEERYE